MTLALLKADMPTASPSREDSKGAKTTPRSTSSNDTARPCASRSLFHGLGITYDDRFLRSILKPRDSSFDAHRRMIFVNLRENTLAGWHKLALDGVDASEAERDELLKSEMQLRKMEFDYLDRQGEASSDRTVRSIKVGSPGTPSHTNF